MINTEYAKAILNTLFAKRANGSDIHEERRTWKEQGIPDELTAEEYREATDDKKQEYDRWKKMIDASLHWETSTKETSSASRGWKIVQKEKYNNPIMDKYYPTTRYLALFTTMPNADGTGFVEPYQNNNTSTTYRRIDLEHAFFSDTNIMHSAVLNESEGGAKSLNQYAIYFPEINNVDWSTQEQPLIGFGIFANASPVDNETPYLWGTLSNTEAVVATIGHVPLFRIGDFQLSIA